MNDLQGVWLWGSVSIALMAIGIVRSWIQLSQNSQNTSKFTWAAVATLFCGLGYQCSHNISLISSLAMMLLPMSLTILLLTQILNLKLKTPLLVLMSNPLAILLLLAGIRFVDGSNIEGHKELGSFMATHLLFLFISFLVIFLSSMVATVLLLQNLKLKRKINFKVSLPSLDFLERIVRSLNNLALFILTCGIGAGGLYVSQNAASISVDWPDNTFYWTLITWGCLCIVNILHFTNRITGLRFAWCNYIVLMATIITLLGQSHG
jgi:ABC-type uncharacterized transport system permease subunit